MSSPPIPVVDFAPFLDGSAKQQAADQLLASFKSAGFVYLTNFGIPDGEVQEMFDWVKQFFALPHEKKMLAPHPDSGTHHRGYSYPEQEKVIKFTDSGDDSESTITPRSVKESFDCGSENDEFMPNIWLPDGVLPGFNEACLSFFWKCRKVELNLLRALAVGFGLEEEWFLKYHEAANNQLRLLHYPSISHELLEANKVKRLTAHTDFDTFTFLFQDGIGGLEVEDPNEPGKYVAATPIPNSIVLNAGDFLKQWANDTVRSTMHRVGAPPGVAAKDGLLPSRYSIPYFCAPDMSMIIDAIPGTWSADQPKKYEPVSVKEYAMKRFAAAY